jgi:hypothetical protein
MKMGGIGWNRMVLDDSIFDHFNKINGLAKILVNYGLGIG